MNNINIVNRINSRLDKKIDNPIVTNIFIDAVTEIKRLHDKVLELQVENERLNRISKYNS